jgi:glycosyltransferase involved in cell wall biosynthesis
LTLAILHPGFRGVGGAEIMVATQARYLRRAGVDLCVATWAFDAGTWRQWLDGVPIRLVPKTPLADLFSSSLGKLERAAARVSDCLRDCSAVVACNSPANAVLGASSIPARRTWYCTEPSRDWHLVRTNPRLYERVTSNPDGVTDVERDFATRLKAYQRATQNSSATTREIAFDIEKTTAIDTILAISEFSRDNVRRVYDRNDAQIIYPIVRFPEARVRPRGGLDRTGLKILTHSRLEIVKNVDHVVRAFALVLPKVSGSTLHVVGEGNHRKRLERLTHELGISSAVQFHGYVPENDLDRVYDACDVFALTPLDEPFGMVFPEAAARGLLLVGPDHGGPFEILDGGRLGWVCDPFSPEALADAFLRIWSLPDDEVTDRRAKADKACRDRFAEAVIGPELVQALAETPRSARH